jgi:hypothetical protein
MSTTEQQPEVAPAADALDVSHVATDATKPEVAATVPAATADTAAAPAPAAITETTAPAPSETKEPTEKKEPATESTPIGQLWTLAKASGHPEIWGVTLADPADHVPTRIILQKYLNANDGDLTKAKDQLTKTLEWRAKTKPIELISKVFSKAKFDGLGYVTKYAQEGSNEPEGKEVFTWNIYGGVKSMDETFGKLEE